MTNKIDPSTLSGTELLLRQRYAKHTLLQESLQSPVSASNVELLHTHKQANKVSPVGSQEVIYKSASGRTGVITVLMDSTKYDDADITNACAEFNNLHPERMSNSYQLPCTYEGIQAGSWVFIEYPEETNGSNK
ncbi:hypothetical protein E5170_02715 [Pseudomonas atacamensis]|uniref:Uncharacterized protein n=1 Tax=Pseudomonas atacamensis TaxID=2565368 RepID=A0AAQ2DFV3_9PSED|nr:hypothetical protein [Pseudomonas atacamensis]THF36376.1 hypothetical protein E5170_02715 [Pseudomonas atacamensis]